MAGPGEPCLLPLLLAGLRSSVLARISPPASLLTQANATARANAWEGDSLIPQDENVVRPPQRREGAVAVEAVEDEEAWGDDSDEDGEEDEHLNIPTRRANAIVESDQESDGTEEILPLSVALLDASNEQP